MDETAWRIVLARHRSAIQVKICGLKVRWMTWRALSTRPCRYRVPFNSRDEGSECVG
jgi:hypothetical protein